MVPADGLYPTTPSHVFSSNGMQSCGAEFGFLSIFRMATEGTAQIFVCKHMQLFVAMQTTRTGYGLIALKDECDWLKGMDDETAAAVSSKVNFWTRTVDPYEMLFTPLLVLLCCSELLATKMSEVFDGCPVLGSKTDWQGMSAMIIPPGGAAPKPNTNAALFHTVLLSQNKIEQSTPPHLESSVLDAAMSIVEMFNAEDRKRQESESLAKRVKQQLAMVVGPPAKKAKVEQKQSSHQAAAPAAAASEAESQPAAAAAEEESHEDRPNSSQ